MVSSKALYRIKLINDFPLVLRFAIKGFVIQGLENMQYGSY